MTNPLDSIHHGPVASEYHDIELRVDSDDEKKTITIYPMKPGTTEAASQLTFTWMQARQLAHWIMEATSAD